MAAKYAIGLREARECRYWLRLVKADQPQLTATIDKLVDECSQLIAVLTPTVRKLRAEVAAQVATAVILGLAALKSVSHLLGRF